MAGGKAGPDGVLGAVVTYVKKNGPADACGIAEGDQVRKCICQVYSVNICTG